jgi:hypothetical protein
MTTSIEPAPSLQEILAHAGTAPIGQVDFTALVDLEDETAAAPAAAPVAAAATVEMPAAPSSEPATTVTPADQATVARLEEMVRRLVAQEMAATAAVSGEPARLSAVEDAETDDVETETAPEAPETSAVAEDVAPEMAETDLTETDLTDEAAEADAGADIEEVDEVEIDDVEEAVTVDDEDAADDDIDEEEDLDDEDVAPQATSREAVVTTTAAVSMPPLEARPSIAQQVLLRMREVSAARERHLDAVRQELAARQTVSEAEARLDTQLAQMVSRYESLVQLATAHRRTDDLSAAEVLRLYAQASGEGARWHDDGSGLGITEIA